MFNRRARMFFVAALIAMTARVSTVAAADESVPTRDALVSPDDSARPPTFWMGSKQFDPVRVGYSGVEIKGATLFDTTRPGNLNTGHRFKDGPLGKGVIGRALTAEERAQIIEFLKSL